MLQLFVWPAALHRSHSTHIMLVKTSHPLRGFTGAHCCRGGYQGGILFTVAGCWLLDGVQVLRAAVCLVPAVLLPLLQSPRWPGCWPAQAAAAVSGPAGCSACVVCSTATLCTTLSRQAVSTACTLTSIFRKLGARLLSGCIPQCKLFLKCKSPTHYCQNYKLVLQMGNEPTVSGYNVVPSPSPNGSAWAILAQCAWTTRPAHGVQGAQICPQKICKPEKK